MKKIKKIDSSNLSLRSGISYIIIWYLFLDKMNAALWIWIVIGAILFMDLTISIGQRLYAEKVDVIEEIEKLKSQKSGSKFSERLDEMAKNKSAN